MKTIKTIMYYWRKPANTSILQLPLASRGSFSLSTPRRIVAYLDGLQGKVNALRELQSTSGEELRRRRTLIPSVLDRAFKGGL